MKMKRPIKAMKDSRNGVPKDRNGRPLKMGQLVEAKVFIRPTEVKLDGKRFSLGPKLSRIYAKLIVVGPEDSTIQPMGEKERKVSNDKITIIA